MRCPFCLNMDSKVLDSRQTEEGASIRRRRECTACGKRFTTYERLDEVPLMVVKKDGRKRTFCAHEDSQWDSEGVRKAAHISADH